MNWSTFIGTDDPDETRRMRYFSNLYGQFRITEKVGLLAGFDLGFQQEIKGSSTYDLWLTPTLIGQYALEARWKTAIRLEYYQDAEGIIISTGTPNGFRTIGLSWNLDYIPAPFLACRLEARWMDSRDPVFRANSGLVDDNFFLGASLAVKLDRQLGGEARNDH
jgi:hypothetical protein